jgi:hypothetical protein
MFYFGYSSIGSIHHVKTRTVHSPSKQVVALSKKKNKWFRSNTNGSSTTQQVTWNEGFILWVQPVVGIWLFNQHSMSMSWCNVINWRFDKHP